MENSFFEYRDATGAVSDSDSEIIDNSLNESLAPKKTPYKNKTAFIEESEESSTDGDGDNDVSHKQIKHIRKSILRKSVIADAHVISSSDDDASKRGSTRRQSKTSSNKIVVSSSDEEEGEASPEMLPKRRPPMTPRSISTNSPSMQPKNNKRIMLMDSDMDNSIVIEHDRHRKLACRKDTPLKIDSGGKNHQRIIQSDDVENDEEDESESDENCKSKKHHIIIESDEEKTGNKKSVGKNHHRIIDSDEEVAGNKKSIGKNHHRIIDSDEEVECNKKSIGKNHHRIIDSDEEVAGNKKSIGKNHHRIIDSDEEVEGNKKSIGKNHHRIIDSDEEVTSNKKSDRKNHHRIIESDEDGESDKENDNSSTSGEEKANSDDQRGNSGDGETDEDDEEQMLMTRATRMSIMGVIPKDNDSDESDFIQSDESHRKSGRSSASSLLELPDVSHAVSHKTPQKAQEPDNDTSTLTCSPFSNSLHDEANHNESKILGRKENIRTEKFIDLTNQIVRSDTKVLTVKNAFPVEGLKSKVLTVENKENCDDDIKIIESKPEIIALSSDDEDEVKAKSPTMDVKIKNEEDQSKAPKTTMKHYLVPPSYPNQVVYVKKHVKENELSKLEGLKADLHNVRNILENMDVQTLPDGGTRVIQRLTALEAEVRRQGDKVANMVVEPDVPTVDDIARDGFDKKPAKGLSWDEIQKASNAVQPKMFGKQAMATHMAERNLILERLRNLHESLASRPPETSQQPAPSAVRSALMPHQLHALAWLRWRETQRPCGGILADDMGLGKTITIISLILADKENRIDDDDGDDEEEYNKGSSKLPSGGSLVVCPASLMQQWAGEVSKHCAPHALSVCLHHGASRAQQPHRLAVHDLVVTTYNILQRDKEKNGVLMRIRWRRVILDEAHIVRNHKAATSVAVAALRGKRRWCLTGTPVQNKDLDLFALLKFLRCTPFDDLTMWKKWIDNKSQGGQDRLSTLMRAVLLRRTKLQLQQAGQLACLPPRTAHQCTVKLAKNEMNVYQKVLVFSKTLFAQFLHQRAEKQADANGHTSAQQDSAYYKMHKKMIALQGAKPVKSHEILVLLLRLRQVCCHCGLIAAMLDSEDGGTVEEDPAGQDLLAELNKLTLEDSHSVQNDSKIDEAEEEGAVAEEGTSVAEAIRSVLSPNNPVFDLTRQSSKILAVMACLHDNVFVNKEDKAVVVSQWTSVLRLVERELGRAGVQSVTLSGSVPVPARPPLIEAINNPASKVRVMLLSLCAGGVGLNLCGANHLLLLDPHWNPQLEEQAQDRIYRVGQKKPVHIYRFMCVETVEQSIRKLQENKLALAESVLTGAKNTNASKLTIEDLKMLFNMGQPEQ